MVQKKRKLITHIILIFLIIVILFPVVWVITTSIRRDEAAFSTKLFSSRVSLQNYRDLVFPEKNLPYLIQSLQSMIQLVKPYDSWDKDKLNNKIDNYIDRVENYLLETENRLDEVEQSYENIKNYLLEHSHDIKNQVINNIENLINIINISNLQPTIENEAALYVILSKERFNSTTHKALKDFLDSFTDLDTSSRSNYEKALEKLKESYEKTLNGYDKIYLNTENELDKCKFEINELQKKYQVFQNKIFEINIILEKDITPELEKLTESLKNLNNLKENIKNSSTENPYIIDDSEPIKNLEEVDKLLNDLITNLEKLPGYDNLKNILKIQKDEIEKLMLENDSLKNKLVYSNLINIYYSELHPRILKIYNEIKTNIFDIKDIIYAFENLNDQLEKLKNKENELTNKKLEIEKKLFEVQQLFIEPQKVYNLKIFKEKLHNLITSLEKAKSFSKIDLIKYHSTLKTLREFSNSYNEKDELQKNVNKIIQDLNWIEIYRDFESKMEKIPENLKNILIDMEKSLNDFKNSYKELLNLSSNGIFVSSEILNKMYDTVKMDFVNKVRANMSIASRKASILLDLIPFNVLKSDFKNIDKQLFRIDQIWKQKIKHYFWLWVLNSVIISLIVATITTAVCAIAAYPFSRMKFFGRRYGIIALLLIQMFPGVVFMIAIYDLLNFIGRYVSFLGIDTLGGLIFAYLTNIAFNMFLIKGFYDTIPISLEEAAIVDGATRFQSFYKIILPLSRPILTVVFLLIFMGTFNEYVVARIILQDVKHYTYALGLQSFATGPYETEWGLFTAAALLGMAPMIILFLSLQKYLVSGLTRGAIKE